MACACFTKRQEAGNMIRTAQTEYGMVRGMEAADPRVTAFRGIPFAAPPIGENRWRAPQPCESWEGVREAYRFAPISMQETPGTGDGLYDREWHVDPEIAVSEDCLYLNVWTGAKSREEKRPVLVWYFGGAFQCGYTAEMEFDGERLARQGIVVVTVNYRVNVFGFLAHPQLTKEQPEAPSNFGCLDQQAGLQWVIRNIEQFGGDPQNITIAGQSAGGASVMNQLACEKNEGKFQKAIVMSGMIGSPYEPRSFGNPQKLSEAERLGSLFFEMLGVSTLEEARSLDPQFILERYRTYVDQYGWMTPVLDGKFCTGDPYERFLQGKSLAVPVMAGNTRDEFPAYLVAENEAELREKAALLFGEAAEEFLAFPENRMHGEQGYAAVNGIECNIKRAFIERKKSGCDKETYYYRFDADIPGWDEPGSFHSVDLWFFFETLAKCWRPFEGRHYDLAREMSGYWVNFIRSGNPNGKDRNGKELPVWKPYEEANPCGMTFTSKGSIPEETEEDRVRFLVKRMRKEELNAE